MAQASSARKERSNLKIDIDSSQSDSNSDSSSGEAFDSSHEALPVSATEPETTGRVALGGLGELLKQE